MYLEHFKLKELPFRLSPDPAFLFLSQIHSRAKAYMESTIWFTDGFVVITGEIGSGKTTLIESFLKEIDQDVVVAQINQTQVSPIEFLQGLLAQFGFSPFRMRKAELLDTLNNFLIEQHANGRKVLLIIDEAQNLSNKVLEEVRLLSGVETTKEKVLRIILAGQPELNAKLDSDELDPVAPARAAALPPERADRGGDGRLHPPSPQGGRCRGPRDLRAGHVPADLPLHGRHPAPDQHAVRHVPALRLRQRPWKRSTSRSCGRCSANCSGRNTPGARTPTCRRPASTTPRRNRARRSGASCSPSGASRSITRCSCLAASSSAAPPTTTCRSTASS